MNYGIDICLRELLFEQECVIIPDFGGFLTHYKSAEINHLAKLIFPPTKSVAFNRQLKKDDGLLTNTYAVLNNVSYSEAALAVKNWLADFEQELSEKGEAKIAKIGTFFKNKMDETVSFDFEIGQNYLPETYGLSYVKVAPILRNKTAVIKQEPVAVPAAEAKIEIKKEAKTEAKEEEPKSPEIIVKPEKTEKQEAVPKPVLAEPFLKTSEAETPENTEKTAEIVVAENLPAEVKKRGFNFVSLLAGVLFVAAIAMSVLNIHAPNLSLNEASVFSIFSKMVKLQDVLNAEPVVFNENAIPPVSTDIKVAAPVSANGASNQAAASLSADSNRKFEIVLGSFANEANAEKMASEIRKKHADFTVIQYQDSGKSYVVIPAGNNETQAEKLLQKTRENYECWLKKR